MLIRPAEPTDAEAIAEIHITTWRMAYRGQIPDAILDSLDASSRAVFWHDALSAPHNIFVAELGSTTAGFCSLVPSRDNDADSSTVDEIAALYVRPQQWRHGFGHALCSAAVCAAIVTYSTPVGTDNCPLQTTVQTSGLPSGSSFPVGPVGRQQVVADLCPEVLLQEPPVAAGADE